MIKLEHLQSSSRYYAIALFRNTDKEWLLDEKVMQILLSYSTNREKVMKRMTEITIKARKCSSWVFIIILKWHQKEVEKQYEIRLQKSRKSTEKKFKIMNRLSITVFSVSVLFASFTSHLTCSCLWVRRNQTAIDRQKVCADAYEKNKR